MSVLLLAGHDRGILAASFARVLGAARKLGAEVDVLAIGATDQIVEEISGYSGIRTILRSGPLDENDAASICTVVRPLMDEYEFLIGASDAQGKDVIPRVAALLDVMPVTDIIAIETPARFQRPVYAGNAIETVSSDQTITVLSVRATCFAPAPKGESPATVIPLSTAGGQALTRRIKEMRTGGDTPDLGSARIVVGGGQSLGSKEKFMMIKELADVLGAAVGATRAAVDAGYAPNDWQVGQTGKVIAPDLYIAVGISGAIQHLAGIQGAKRIIAINSDPEAPIVKIADLSVIGDLFEIVPGLIASLRAG